MSEETQDWLEQNVRVGFTEPKYGRGNAWWYQGDDVSHYPDAVPYEVAAELLDFPVETRPIAQLVNGVWVEIPERASVSRVSDNRSYQQVPSHYPIHGYKEWLLEKVQQAADAKLDISSVALLRDGGVAFVQFEFPQAIQHEATGELVVPFIGATTSHNGQFASDFKPGTIREVCDNTRRAFHGDPRFKSVKRKHTKKSTLTSEDLREGLGIVVEKITEDYFDELETLTGTPVSDVQWDDFLKLYIPAKEGSKASETKADDKRGIFRELYTLDQRVAPWTGTAWGVLQTVSTFDQHVRQGIGRDDETAADRYQRNALDFILGAPSQTAKSERRALDALSAVLV